MIKVNNQEIKAFNFSGGECQVSIAGIEIGQNVEVYAFLNNSDEIMRLILTVDAIRQINPHADISLHIPYLPYARQDRVCNPGEAFSCAVMAEIINALCAYNVKIEDPHSPISSIELDCAEMITQADIISNSVEMMELIRSESLILLAPDKGAVEKTEAIWTNLYVNGISTERLHAQKVRDVTNGQITDTIIPEGVEGKNILIPDDICDGGRTFIELAKKLKAAGAGDLYLYVTHGIFSKGLEPLKEGFKHVFCKNSFIQNDQPEFLTILE